MQLYSTFGTLFQHHLWANLRLLAACASLSDEQFQTSAVGGYGSIGDTLQHIVHAERAYFSRISTGQPYNHPEDAPPLTFAEMTDSLRRTGEGLIEWAPKVEAADRVEIQWDNGEINELVQVPKAIILTQVINHATEHRGADYGDPDPIGHRAPRLG